jgi:hypothetical protein
MLFIKHRYGKSYRYVYYLDKRVENGSLTINKKKPVCKLGIFGFKKKVTHHKIISPENYFI